jgi:NAD-dependent SIR2 family protein deacetylase
MRKEKKVQNVKMNLSLERDFYELLQQRAKNDYVKVATWTKQYLMKGLLEKNNSDSKCITQNGTNMEL